ncbi:glycosyltransferase family 2 protein [Lactonifactor longoviformis]|uniref:Glycosyltransferase 2-like domain-containing protein n=1 Tax=Lactonifactor longoviformis DSM 17459 TaxID=1122155 RepID=A0A1M5AMH2_9CLOT|nr:glycosyltransferase family 2 protein [Lactonifactor longoviformis]POP32459.1 glycosyltransferase family 2 protein [Lactonifactor longoviformis]SHF31365.1 hypothetical protein SAMN02745158_03253 [Lactonifactor longoviformis DSM 17459]
MKEVSVVIPNFNGIAYMRDCLEALKAQRFTNFEVIVVDNGSSDGSRELVQQEYPEVKLIALSENFGFCRAVNEGIYASSAPYVLLLNNDTKAEKDFVGNLLNSIRKSPKRFSCQGKMVQMHDPSRIDDAGNYYCALGWAFARGKGKLQEMYQREEKIFAACGGASIYRKSIMKEIGYFDEEHFAYLEDIDIGYRARIYGYENIFTPDAVVHHVGSGTSGSRYNLFKVRYSSRNNIYLIYKNMPLLQILWNLPLLLAGFLAKEIFFAEKGFAREYAAGIVNGFRISAKEKKVKFSGKHLINYLRIQWELYLNIVRRLMR